MNPLIYNTSIAIGLSLVGIGTAMINIPLALIVTGALVLALTIYATTKR